MSLLRRRTVLRRFFAALERIASNVGLIREAGKEFRLFSAEASLPCLPALPCLRSHLPRRAVPLQRAVWPLCCMLNKP